MEEKRKGYLNLPPGAERDYRLLMADKLLTALSPEMRMETFQKAFLESAKDFNDKAAFSIICAIGQEYYIKEREIADKTDKHYGNANYRADKTFGGYLRNVYWELPDKKQTSATPWPSSGRPIYGPILLKTKAFILKVCVGQWAGYYDGKRCFEEINDESRAIFSFLINAYNGLERQRYVSKEEKDEILKLFREKTDFAFTPKIAEKWLSWGFPLRTAIPKEIKKIFIIARAKNGGMKLVERDIRNAEILKPLEVEKCSEAALEFHQKFCEELKELDDKMTKSIEEIREKFFVNAEGVELKYFSLSYGALHVRFKKGDAPYVGFEWYRDMRELGLRIRDHFSKCQIGRYIEIHFIFWEGDYNWGSYFIDIYLG